MYNGIGLNTPRGSGTNGFVQKNKSHLNSSSFISNPITSNKNHHLLLQQHAQTLSSKKPNQAILDHEHKRSIELKCMQLQIKLENDSTLSESDINQQVTALRTKLTDEANEYTTINSTTTTTTTNSHNQAQMKLNENKQMANALGIDQDGYVPGTSFDQQLQAERKQVRLNARLEMDNARETYRHAMVLSVIVNEINQNVRPHSDLLIAETELGLTWDSVKHLVNKGGHSGASGGAEHQIEHVHPNKAHGLVPVARQRSRSPPRSLKRSPVSRGRSPIHRNRSPTIKSNISRSRSPIMIRYNSRSRSPRRRNRSRLRSPRHRNRSRSLSPRRRNRSWSRSPRRRNRIRSRSPRRRNRSRSRSPIRRNRSRSRSPIRRIRSHSRSPRRRKVSRSPIPRARSPTFKNRSQSPIRRIDHRSPSVIRDRSRSISRSPSISS